MSETTSPMYCHDCSPSGYQCVRFYGHPGEHRAVLDDRVYSWPQERVHWWHRTFTMTYGQLVKTVVAFLVGWQIGEMLWRR